MNDVIEVLKHDHRKVEQIFEKIETAQSGTQREALFVELSRELEAHATAEETTLYPNAEKFAETQDLAEHAYEEHNDVRDLISQLQELDPTEDEWMETFHELKENVEHHVEDEEEELFPKLRQLFSAEQLRQMATDIVEAKREFRRAG